MSRGRHRKPSRPMGQELSLLFWTVWCWFYANKAWRQQVIRWQQDAARLYDRWIISLSVDTPSPHVLG